MLVGFSGCVGSIVRRDVGFCKSMMNCISVQTDRRARQCWSGKDTRSGHQGGLVTSIFRAKSVGYCPNRSVHSESRADWDFPVGGRLFAVGDIHGDVEVLNTMLRGAGKFGSACVCCQILVIVFSIS